jgi:hypothetical protein
MDKEKKQSKEFYEELNRETIIENVVLSIYHSAIQRGEKVRFLVDKDVLTFKIVDIYGLTEAKAKDILMRIQSRGFIEIEKYNKTIIINVANCKKHLDAQIKNLFEEIKKEKIVS